MLLAVCLPYARVGLKNTLLLLSLYASVSTCAAQDFIINKNLKFSLHLIFFGTSQMLRKSLNAGNTATL